jgi:hypothetical protein
MVYHDYNGKLYQICLSITLDQQWFADPPAEKSKYKVVGSVANPSKPKGTKEQSLRL